MNTNVDKIQKELEGLSQEVKKKFEQMKKDVPNKKDIEELKKSVDVIKREGVVNSKDVEQEVRKSFKKY